MNRPAQPRGTMQFESKGFVYCPICTHTVEGTVVSNGKTAKVKPGNIMRLDRAA
jgi:uncharacterized Zn finger protein (UPF0148 family)